MQSCFEQCSSELGRASDCRKGDVMWRLLAIVLAAFAPIHPAQANSETEQTVSRCLAGDAWCNGFVAGVMGALTTFGDWPDSVCVPTDVTDNQATQVFVAYLKQHQGEDTSATASFQLLTALGEQYQCTPDPNDPNSQLLFGN